MRRALLLLGLTLATGCSGLVDAFAFHPQPADPARPPVQTETISEVELSAADGTQLQAFFIENAESDVAVLFLHGNAGNAYHRLGDASALSAAGSNVLLLSYRGYGKSGGSPSEAGVYLDAEAALEYLERVRGFDVSRLFVLGRSIGSTVAVHVAQNRSIAGLILVTPLSSGRDIAMAHGLGWLLPLAGNPFDSVAKLPNLRCPMLVVHGDRDEVVPYAHGRKLFEAYTGPKRFQPVAGARHNDLIDVAGPSYWRWIREFLTRRR